MAKFSEEVISLAQKAEKEHGVPASVTLAQYAYESGYGTSGLATSYNNYFGMKYRNGAGNSDASKWYTDKNGTRWQVYSSMAQSFDDHGRLLSSNKYSALTKNATTVEEYVKAFSETYAPSSDGNNNYAANILQIIRDFDLTQYDSGNYSATGSSNIEISLGGAAQEQETTEIVGVENNYKWYEADYWLGMLGTIVKFVVMVGIIFFAFILIMKAFNIKMPSLKKKAKESGEGEEA